MWHPHLKRDRIDDNNFQVIDSRRNFEENFPIFLEMKNSVREKKENTYNSEKLNNEVIFNPKNNKMKCVCKFVLDNRNFVSDENRNLSITPIPKGNDSSKAFFQTKLSNGKHKNEKAQKNKNQVKNLPKKFMRNSPEESLLNDVVDENTKINKRQNNALSSRDVEKLVFENNQNQNNSNYELNNLIKNNDDILPRNNYEEEEIKKKYLSVVNDIRKVQSPVNSRLKAKNELINPQKQSFNNENLFLEKSKLEDFKSNLNLNLNKILKLNNFHENKYLENSSDPKIFPIDISNYRLKEIESKISLPNNNKKNESKNFNLNEINENNIRNQFNFKQNPLKNSNEVLINQNLFLDQNMRNSKDYLNLNKNDIRYKRFDDFENMKNMKSGPPIDSANFSKNTILNNSQNTMYKNILDYLSYNNQMMQNIQKLLLSNNAILNNPIESVEKSDNYFLENSNNLKSNFMSSPFTIYNKINNINDGYDKFKYQNNFENNLKLEDTFKNKPLFTNPILNENKFTNSLKTKDQINNKQLQKDLFEYLNAKSFENINENETDVGTSLYQNDIINNPFNKIIENSSLSNINYSNQNLDKNAYLNNNNNNFNVDLLSRFLNIN